MSAEIAAKLRAQIPFSTDPARLAREAKALDGGTPPAFSVVLPMPPSLNNIYATVGKRRVKVQGYTDWLDLCLWIIAGQIQQGTAFRIAGSVTVQIELPAKMRGDIDNRIKPILDVLVKSNRIDDDRNVAAVHAMKTRDAADVFVTVSASVARAA